MNHASAHLRFGAADPDGVRWCLRRNCSVAPRHLCGVLFGLGLVSLGIAAWFWSLGATLVLPFALIEVLVLVGSFVVYARHATDAEHISLVSGRLVIDVERGGVRDRVEFLPCWVRVDVPNASGGLIELSGQGRRVTVGRHVRPDWRPALANEIRRALASGGGRSDF